MTKNILALFSNLHFKKRLYCQYIVDLNVSYVSLHNDQTYTLVYVTLFTHVTDNIFVKQV